MSDLSKEQGSNDDYGHGFQRWTTEEVSSQAEFGSANDHQRLHCFWQTPLPERKKACNLSGSEEKVLVYCHQAQNGFSVAKKSFLETSMEKKSYFRNKLEHFCLDKQYNYDDLCLLLVGLVLLFFRHGCQVDATIREDKHEFHDDATMTTVLARPPWPWHTEPSNTQIHGTVMIDDQQTQVNDDFKRQLGSELLRLACWMSRAREKWFTGAPSQLATESVMNMLEAEALSTTVWRRSNTGSD